MNLVDELERLSALHRDGALTDEEFARAKAALLAPSDAPSFPEAQSDPIFVSESGELQPGGTGPADRSGESALPAGAGADLVASHLADLRYENELARIDREWEMEREQYMVRGRRGNAHVPGTGDVVGLICVALFGVFWTGMTFTLTRSAPGPLETPVLIFPFFGVIFTVGALVSALNTWSKVEAYRTAYDAWQARRRALERADSGAGRDRLDEVD